MASNQEFKSDIAKQLREKQDRFVYYIIALSVASVGFTITQTINEKLHCDHILVGLALIFWMASIFCGFQFLKIIMKGLHRNALYFDIIDGRIPNVPAGKVQEEVASEMMVKRIKSYEKQSVRNFKWQQIFFYVGLTLFIMWHIIHMYLQR